MSDFQRKKIRPWDDIESLIPIDKQRQINKEPISNQLVTNKVSNKQSISNQLVINREAKEQSKKPIKEPISNPTGNHNKEPISNQLVTQLVTDNGAKTAIKRLSGLQKKILFFIVAQCVSEGHLVSSPVTNETLREITETDADTVKTAVHRLVKEKQLIQRVEGQRGKGGFTCFGINVDIRNAVLEYKKSLGISNQLVTQLVTDNSNQLVTNKVPNREPNASSSSSSILENNKNTTTTELPPEWQEIDLTKLHERNVRFGKEHIVQLFSYLKNHSAFDFQESIDAFVYDIEHGHVSGRKGLLNLFIGAIRNGTLYISSHYVSPYQQKLNEMTALAKQRTDHLFLQWVEENREEILKQVEAHDISLAIDFRHGGKESLHWVKRHLFLKKP